MAAGTAQGLLQFQADADEAARLAMLERLEAAVAARPSMVTLAAILEALSQALQDPSPAVLKRAIPAAYVAFRPGHAAALALGRGPQVPEDVAAVWAACSGAKQRVSQLLTRTESGLDGVRMLGARFLENALLLISAEHSANPKAQHALLSATMVAKETDGMILQLVSLIKAPGLTALPGPLAIVILKGLGSIAQQRPLYLGRILPTLLSLASTVNQPQGGTQSSASIKRALKDALLSVLRCKAPQALTWHKKVVVSLQSLGAGEAAEAEFRRAERQAKRERGRDIEDTDVGAKRQRVEEPIQELPANSALPQAQLSEQAPPPNLPVPRQPASERPLMERLLHECADVTAVNDLFQVIAIMSTLAAEKDLSTLQAFSSGLAPGVMADIVIANLDHLPQRGDVSGAQNASSGTGALASLMQGLSDYQPAAAQAQLQQGSNSAGPPQGVSDSAAKPKAAPAKRTSAPGRAARPAPKPIIKKQPPPQMKLKPLAPNQEASLRLGAIQRILASEAVPAQHLRSSVLAALASRAPAGDPAADLVLQHILANFRQPGSYSLALQWLYSLFVAYSKADILAEHETAASAHVNAPQLRAALASALDDGDLGASSQGKADERLPLPGPDSRSQSASGSLHAAQQLAQETANHSIKGGSAASGAVRVKAEQQRSAAAGQVAGLDAPDAIAVSGTALAVQDEDMELQQSNGEAGTSGRDHAADLAGTLYETVLLAILEGLREQVSPDEKLIPRLLIDCPALPHEGVMAFLRDVSSGGGDWATLALSSAYGIIMKRPPDRASALQLVLEAATGPDADIRNKAVRLVANRLYPERFLQDTIADFAASKVKELLPARGQPPPALRAGPAANSKGTALALPASAAAAETSRAGQPGVSRQSSPAPEASSGPAQQREGIRNGHKDAMQPDLEQPKVKQEGSEQEPAAGVPHRATNGVPEKALPQLQAGLGSNSSRSESLTEGMHKEIPPAAKPIHVDPTLQDAVPSSTYNADAAGQSADLQASGEVSIKQEVSGQAQAEADGQVAAEPKQAPQAGAVALVPEQVVQVAPLSADEAAERCELLCALCTKSPDLMRLLLEVFGKAEMNGKKAISKNARLLARAVGPQAPIWVELLNRIPPKSEQLLLSMLLPLTGDIVPPKALADACMAAYARLKQARFAVPALAALERPRALSLLPKLVPLEAPIFKAAMHRLLLPQPNTGEPLLAPQEILAALITLNPQAEGLPLKSMTGALSRCFEMRDTEQSLVFHTEALASTMQQLVVRSPLPLLFMRFVIQSLVHAPQLRPFVCDILSTLVNKAVWTNKGQWTGWVKCVQDLVPESLPVLLQLPVGNLETALKELAPAVTVKAEAFLDSPKCGPLPKQTQAVVRARAAALKQASAAKEESASGAKTEAGSADEKPAEVAPAREKADA